MQKVEKCLFLVGAQLHVPVWRKMMYYRKEQNSWNGTWYTVILQHSKLVHVNCFAV